MSWTEVGMDGEPVRGNVDAFVSAVAKWRTVNQSATAVQNEFRSIIAGHVMVGFEGAAAISFAKVVEGVQHVLDDLPAVSESIRSVLDTHRTQLESFRKEADQALARAKVAKAECVRASSALKSCEARRTSLQRQVQQLKAGPEPDEAQVLSVERLLSAATRERIQRTDATAVVQGQLDAERKKWGQLRASEDELNRRIAEGLRSIDLLSLRDPGWIEQQFTSFTGFIGNLGSDLFEAVGAALLGDWDAALFHLRDALDKILKVLDVVSFVLLAVGTVLVFTGVGAPLGAALIGASRILSLVTFALAVTKVVITSELMKRNATHPETGQKLAMSDLLFDGVRAAFAGLGALGPKTSLTRGHVGDNVARDFVAEQIGISFKKYSYRINWGETTFNVVKIVVKGSEFYDVPLHPGDDTNLLDLTESSVNDNRSTPPTVREQSIRQGLDDIRSGRPGIVTPVLTNVVSF